MKEKILAQAKQLLGEHFDAVQILVSWNEEGLTRCQKAGSGNWYARIGMAEEFLAEDQARNQAIELKRVLGKEG